MTCPYHKTFKGSTSNAFKTHQRLFKGVQYFKLNVTGSPCHAQKGLCSSYAGRDPKSKPSAPYKNDSPSTWPIYVLGRNSDLPFLCPPRIEGWGSQFLPRASPCGLAAADFQMPEGTVTSESGKLRGTSCKRHLHNPNELEMSSRKKNNYKKPC